MIVNAIMGQLISGVATRIFMVSMPSIATTLDADILAVGWALERRASNPVVNFALFRIRMFVFSALSLLLFAITGSTLAFLLPRAQRRRGRSSRP